jgi:iron complex outermembrane receptor protein
MSGRAPSRCGLFDLLSGCRQLRCLFAAQLSILPSLELDLGGRETWDRKSANYAGFAPNALGIAAIVGPEGPEALRFKDTKPSYRASLSWHLTPRVMAFATFATGYKTGGFNSGPANRPLGQARTFA